MSARGGDTPRILATRSLLALALLWLAAGAPAVAQERILHYHSDIQVLADGAMEVTETIRVRAEGRQIRRGIYRDFPVRYRDRHGNRVNVDFQVVGVHRNGRPEPWFTERVGNAVRLNTGDDRFLPTPGEFEFTLAYRTSRQLGFFEDFDELYWNVTGNDWAFDIARASATVRLPGPVTADELRLEYFTGPFGAAGRQARVQVLEPGLVRFETTAPLARREGLTIAVGWPKGLVDEPGRGQRLVWLLADNRGVLLALAGLVLVSAFYYRQWDRKGRDPAPGPRFPRYDPPAGYSPGGLRYLLRRSYDHRCLVADLVDLAVRGHLIIRREKKGRTETWTLEQLPGTDPEGLSPAQQSLRSRLFAGGPKLELKSGESTRLQKAMRAQQRALARRYQPRYFILNAGTVAIGFVISIVFMGLALAISAGGGIPMILGIGAVLLLINVLFTWLMQAPTETGRRLMDEAEGLKDYLGVAERQDLARLGHRNPDEPTMDPPRFEALLPWALALGVEGAWTKKFEAAVGVAAAREAAAGVGWYAGNAARLGSLGELGSALGSTFSSQVRTTASPPGSSSGTGGGGFSGGGGGGGGGGGR